MKILKRDMNKSRSKGRGQGSRPSDSPIEKGDMNRQGLEM